MLINQITFSGVLSEPRVTFTIRKSYRADSQDDAIMSQLPGCEISSVVRMIKRNIYLSLISGTTQPTCDKQCGGAARDMQYASKRDRRTLGSMLV